MIDPQSSATCLAKHRLTFVALSSGSIRVDSADPATMIDQHVKNARFLRDAGGRYLQLTVDRPSGRAVTDADYATAGRLLADIGRRTADLGIPLGFHPHMGSLPKRPEELDRVMDAADPRHVRLLLDVAHYQQGGGDPVDAIRRYRDRLLFLHIKDVRDRPTAAVGISSSSLARASERSRHLCRTHGGVVCVDGPSWSSIRFPSQPLTEGIGGDVEAVSRVDRHLALRRYRTRTGHRLFQPEYRLPDRVIPDHFLDGRIGFRPFHSATYDGSCSARPPNKQRRMPNRPRIVVHHVGGLGPFRLVRDERRHEREGPSHAATVGRRRTSTYSRAASKAPLRASP